MTSSRWECLRDAKLCQVNCARNGDAPTGDADLTLSLLCLQVQAHCTQPVLDTEQDQIFDLRAFIYGAKKAART